LFDTFSRFDSKLQWLGYRKPSRPSSEQPMK
jgi:hypothetical protein